MLLALQKLLLALLLEGLSLQLLLSLLQQELVELGLIAEHLKLTDQGGEVEVGVVGVLQALFMLCKDGRLPRLVLPLVGAPKVGLMTRVCVRGSV